MKMQMTAGFWANACATILANPKTPPEERESVIEQMRAIAQAAADADLVELVKSSDITPGRQ